MLFCESWMLVIELKKKKKKKIENRHWKVLQPNADIYKLSTPESNIQQLSKKHCFQYN